MIHHRVMRKTTITPTNSNMLFPAKYEDVRNPRTNINAAKNAVSFGLKVK
jgi:hypothetical protein